MTNNLQALIQEYAKSGKSREQIAIILDKMGIIPELIEGGINMYYPKKTTIKMTIKEKFNLEGRINTLKEAMKSYSVDSTKGYYIGQITEICDRYLKPIVAEASQVKIDEAIAKINDLKQSLVEYNAAVNECKKEMKPDEINAVLQTINEQQIALTNYTNTQKNASVNKTSHAIIAKQMIRELKAFDWLNPVGQFIMEVEKALTENSLGVVIEEAYAALDTSNSRGYYKVGLDKLNELRSMSESDMRKAVSAELGSLRWVPQVNAVYEHNIQLSKDINDDTNNVVIKRHSYVVEHADGILFSLNSQPYYVKENVIIPFDVNKVNALFLTLMAVEETFRIDAGEAITSRGNNVFSMALDKNQKVIFKFNGKVLEMKDGNALRQFLVTTGGYRLNEQATVNTIVATYENLGSIKELDFVRSITSRRHNGLQYNVMKMNESIYINKINAYMGRNIFEKYETAEDAVKEVKEALNYDISNMVIEQLAAEKQANAKIEEEKAEILDKILFLKEKREELSKADQANPAIKEATTLIVSEIEKFQKMYNNIVEKCDKKKVEEAKFDAGTKVKIGDKIGTVKGWSETTGDYTVLFDDGITTTCKEGNLKAVNESDNKPGDKVKCKGGKIGTIKGWNDSTRVYTVLFDDGTTGDFKDDEVTPDE